MVHDESFVLPSASAFHSESSLPGDADAITVARSSRPCLDDGWMDEDHYHQSADEPADVHVANEWKEKYHDLDEIRVNGALKKQWTRGTEETQQVTAQCKNIIGKESLRREDFVEHFYGANSPLFDACRRRLGWGHPHFLKFVSTSMRLSANQWTIAKLYDRQHPQLNVN
jgi:hypothetical protein